MTPQQIAIVKETWRQVAPHAERVAEAFYARLFELDPSLRGMFKKDMRTQGRMLTSVITLAVWQLDELDKLIPVVRQMGQRHSAYGVRDEHYETVGAALLDTLAAGLGSNFTVEAQDAWAETYMLLANTMKSGAMDAPAALAA